MIGIPKETFPGESRVSLAPATLPVLKKAGLQVLLESGAGATAGFSDSGYLDRGAELTDSRDEIFARSDVVLQVRGLGANPEKGLADVPRLKAGSVHIGFLDPLAETESARKLAEAGVTAFAMELIPRISRAQSMDALSSMATIAGYKAVLLAAESLPRMFPMLMTAAGTISPARVFVVGVGVAGLQAIATARRLGAVVRAYDVRPAVKEQVESLGAKFVELPLEAGDAEDKGGYAKRLEDDFYRRQREMMTEVLTECDAVITTAAVPGKRAPILVTKAMLEGMAPGSVLVDLAAERGGNCDQTRPGETAVTENGVRILGPLNLPATVPYHASQMYSKNVSTFLLHLVKDGQLGIDDADEIVCETLIVRNGVIVHPLVKEALQAG